VSGRGHVRRRGQAAALGAALAAAAVAAGCDETVRIYDSRPIPLVRGAGGELLVRVAEDDGVTPALGLLDTGSPLTVWRSEDPEARIVRRDVTLVGEPVAAEAAPVRAWLRDVLTVETTLGAVGTAADNLSPRLVLGGDLLGGLSVEISGYGPTLTFWRRQPASDGFLATVGYAVLHLPRRGGGQLVALDPADRLGQRQRHQFPPSRLLLRVCAAPIPFDRTQAPPTRCCPAEEHRLRTGTDLALVLSTGVGPVVLGRAAWERVRARLADGELAPLEERPLLVAMAARPVPAQWTRLPRLALVNAEAPREQDLGPCAELQRARRLELVAISQAANATRAACALPCDRDPREPALARNTAAYVELGDSLEVAIVDDVTPFLQAIRTEVRPAGPEVDGLLGAAALAGTRVEMDPFEGDTRAIFTCESALAPERCRAVARCARLPDGRQRRACFGLPAHGLPEMCEDAAACAD
jgi:hypothetical protein